MLHFAIHLIDKSCEPGTRFFLNSPFTNVSTQDRKVTKKVMLLFTGVCRPHMTIRKGKRCSTAKAYLRPAMKRRNLHVVAESHVTKVCLLAGLAQLIHCYLFLVA